jgi:pimeloyl-ACP methyl ester carboxylesterase
VSHARVEVSIFVDRKEGIGSDELHSAPQSWAERAYPKLIHYNKVDKGGHFAAWEQPQLFSEEVRAGFRLCAK